VIWRGWKVIKEAVQFHQDKNKMPWSTANRNHSLDVLVCY